MWTPPPACDPVDFDCDGDIDIDDVNALTLVGNLTGGVSVNAGTTKFDLNGDNSINTADLDKWRADAATLNGFGSPYSLGDANLDGDVDVFQPDGNGDAQVLTSNIGTASGAVWGDGDFNADGDVDIFDFAGTGDAQVLTNNLGSFSDTGAAVAAVPEPATIAILATLLPFVLSRRRRS